MSDETAKLILVMSGIIFGMLCGAVASKSLVRALDRKGMRIS